MEQRYRAKLVRYAADLVILCASDVTTPLAVLKSVMSRLGLKLNEGKTHTVNAWKKRFDFLGFSFGMRISRSSGKYYPHTEPSKRSKQRVKTRVKELTNRRLTLLPLPIVVKTVNYQLAGWSNYFHYGNCTTVFGAVKRHVEERMRTH